ncbi:MAG: cytochrome c [Thiohalophilus sp.]|uniref:c-type cytochrome n=1 Tax=Thiohalophilus sp. TaxID=3028392 RepID=UPI0028707443|nr:cytochrome c [Thiohalophilus sp.]MDR9437134.1 cytochrome c [Thiohalophilus sp.]
MWSRLSFGVLLIAGMLAITTTGWSAESISNQRAAELRHMVLQDCGSCHGLTLKGGLGPALTPQAIGDKPKDAMLATVLHGRPGTPMPPWSNLLSREEARWIIELLYRGVDE